MTAGLACLQQEKNLGNLISDILLRWLHLAGCT